MHSSDMNKSFGFLVLILVALSSGSAETSAEDPFAKDPAVEDAATKDAATKDLVVDRFDQPSYHGWTATGEAFLRGPAIGAELLSHLEIENTSDHRLASSEIDGDQAQGTLTSDPFEIKRDYIGFRIAGGRYEQSTCINLLVDGKVVRSATGWRSDRLTPTSWGVRGLQGRTVQLEIVDRFSGDWGHINVDDIVMTNAPEALPNVVAPLYQELLRPQFHITARQWTMNRLAPEMREEGWINDINGLIYYEGEWHFFAQRWAKCWLHMVSTDLIHWNELEPAFWEESEGSGVQSGFCVIDYKNTSGLSDDPQTPPMVAFWSRFDQLSQCISYSLDRGRNWKHYENNPIMEFRERDPKVFWYEPGGHWVMVLYGDHQYHIFNSDNLLEWTNTGHPIQDCWECPDFFELPIDGNVENKKWVLIHGDGRYNVGEFDGKLFTPDFTERYPCDIGDFYATQSWHNTDTGDGRRVQTAWMRFSNFPNMPFSQQCNFPCELKLRTTSKGLRIYRNPVGEIGLLHRGQAEVWKNRTLQAQQAITLAHEGQLFHIQAEFDIASDARLIFNIRGVPLVLTKKRLELGPHASDTREPITSVEILVDRTSIEVFVNKGELSCSHFMLPQESGLSVKSEGGASSISSLELYRLNSAWKAHAKVDIQQ